MLIRNIAISAIAALGLSAGGALAAGAAGEVKDYDFSFEGPFGTFDENQLQRGLQVYTEVCAACHGLQYVPLRTLHDEGGPALPEDQVADESQASADFLIEVDRVLTLLAEELLSPYLRHAFRGLANLAIDWSFRAGRPRR